MLPTEWSSLHQQCSLDAVAWAMRCVQHLQDTVAIIWLNDTAQTQKAVDALQAHADGLGIQELLYGDRLVSPTYENLGRLLMLPNDVAPMMQDASLTSSTCCTLLPCCKAWYSCCAALAIIVVGLNPVKADRVRSGTHFAARPAG
jgi:hypothetical protein